MFAAAALPLVAQAIPEVAGVAKEGIKQSPSIITAIGQQAEKTQFIPQSAEFVEKAATGTIGAIKGTSKAIAHTTFSIAEKMMLATIILIVIILLVIGVSLLAASDYKTGFVFTFFGVLGAAGAFYWAKNPATPGVLGEGEDDMYDGSPVIDMSQGNDETDDEIDFQELEGDIDYIEIEPQESKDKKKRKVHFGGHEDAIMSNLTELISVIEGEHPLKALEDIRKSIEEKGVEAETSIKTIVETINKTLEKKDAIITAYKKLSNEDQTEVKSLLGELKKLSLEVKEKSYEVEGKIMELTDVLASSN
jgi:hypothetical protein